VRTALTLAEVVVILVILGILISMAVPLYMKASERAINREAQAMLDLIVKAEKMYRLELSHYSNCSDAGQCNSELFLNLPSSNDSAWDYQVTASGDQFSVVATRRGADSRTWTVDYDRTADPPETGPYCGGAGATFCE
jgi:type II secretory pathway pseudopilin PulG